MPSETYGCQDLIIAVKKGVSLDLSKFFKDYDLCSYVPIDETWKVKEYGESYDVDLTKYLKTHDIYIIYFRGIDMDDVWEIDEKYLVGVSEDDPDEWENAWDEYADDWFEEQGKVLDHVKQYGGENIVVFYFNQEIQSELF